MIKNIKKVGTPLADAVIGAAATIANMQYPSIEEILRRDLREVEADALLQLCEAVHAFHNARPEGIKLVV